MLGVVATRGVVARDETNAMENTGPGAPSIPELECILAASLSSTESERSVSTQTLQNLSVTPGFLIELIKYLQRDLEGNLPLHRLAGVLMKQCVQNYWQNVEGVNVMSIVSMYQINDCEKDVLRKDLPRLLQTVHDPVLQSTIAAAIGIIGSIDWPENWPELWPCLTEMLNSNCATPVDAAISCMIELVDQMFSQKILELI